MIRKSQIAPCGINCALCVAHQRKRNKCGGCNGPEDQKIFHCTVCKIKNCKERPTGKTGYCSTCKRFPCILITKLDVRYTKKYGVSVINNLEEIKKDGIEKFIKKEEQKWKCIKCGSLLCMHRDNCQNCNNLKLMR